MHQIFASFPILMFHKVVQRHEGGHHIGYGPKF